MAEIRLMTEKDVPAIRAFHEANEAPIGDQELARHAAEPRDALLIAVDGGEVVGRCAAHSYFPPYGELINLLVAESHRDQGIGTALTEACIAHLKANGADVIFLQTDNDNYIAQRLYRGFGFVPTARGEMLRMVRFDDYAPVREFKAKHRWVDTLPGGGPIVSNRQSLWPTQWRNPISSEAITLWLEGESCQAQSGACPVISRLHANFDELELVLAFVGDRDRLPLGGELELALTVYNPRRNKLSVELEVAHDAGLSVEIGGQPKLGSDGSDFVTVKVKAPKNLDKAGLKFSSHRSAPITLRATANGHSFDISFAPQIELG